MSTSPNQSYSENRASKARRRAAQIVDRHIEAIALALVLPYLLWTGSVTGDSSSAEALRQANAIDVAFGAWLFVPGFLPSLACVICRVKLRGRWRQGLRNAGTVLYLSSVIAGVAFFVGAQSLIR